LHIDASDVVKCRWDAFVFCGIKSDALRWHHSIFVVVGSLQKGSEGARPLGSLSCRAVCCAQDGDLNSILLSSRVSKVRSSRAADATGTTVGLDAGHPATAAMTSGTAGRMHLLLAASLTRAQPRGTLVDGPQFDVSAFNPLGRALSARHQSLQATLEAVAKAGSSWSDSERIESPNTKPRPALR
jgi:hypothetical protein